MGSEGVRVLIVAPDRTYAGALAAALASQGDLEVAGLADPDDLVSEVADLAPDVTVIDAAGGLEPMAKVAGVTACLVIGSEHDPQAMIASVEAGALGFLESEAGFEEMAASIRSVAQGIPIIPPTMLGALLRHVVEQRREERLALERLSILTPRERECFELAAQGLDKRAIAEALYISPETARTHLARIFAKLDLHSRAELIALAAQCGLGVGPAEGS